MKSKSLITLSLLALILFVSIPLSANAFTCPGSVAPGTTPSDFDDLACLLIYDIINPLTYVLMMIALLVFFWGIMKVIYAAGDAKKIEEGKKFILWSIIALFVMVSVWGILNFVYSDLFGGSGFGYTQLPE